MANSNWVHADNVDKLRPEAEKFYNYCVNNFSNFEVSELPYVLLTCIEWDYSTHRVLAKFTHSASRPVTYGTFTASTFTELRKQLQLRGLSVPEDQKDVVSRD